MKRLWVERSDAELLVGVMARDHGAWEVFFERESPVLKAVARRAIRCPEDREEIVQQAWCDAWERLEEIGEVREFLRLQVLNLGQSRRKRAKPTESYPALVEAEDGVFPGEPSEGLASIEARELSAREEEVAEELGGFAVKPGERFQERMERRVHSFGARVLDPAELKVAFGLWVGKRQSRARVARELGLTARELKRAIEVIVRKLEAAERAVA